MKLRKNYYGIAVKDSNGFEELRIEIFDNSVMLFQTKTAATDLAKEIVEVEEFNSKQKIVTSAKVVKMTLQAA